MGITFNCEYVTLLNSVTYSQFYIVQIFRSCPRIPADIGTIAQNSNHTFVYTPISAHSELNVSIVNDKLHVDYTSIYGKYFTVTIISVNGTNLIM